MLGSSNIAQRHNSKRALLIKREEKARKKQGTRRRLLKAAKSLTGTVSQPILELHAAGSLLFLHRACHYLYHRSYHIDDHAPRCNNQMDAGLASGLLSVVCQLNF
jgi:hypothetical protein